MRRTYKPKKDTGVLDHRDVYLNMDEKSSAFDAFYIQNIKQTKREISCVGSNKYGVALNKVRKKKYVKRILKEVEPARRETMSRSTYLTPDKSIRVNKALDPFDLLLNSSPARHVECKHESSFDKLLPGSKTSEDLYDEQLPKKEKKNYTKKKTLKTRKFRYSNESTESNKENTDNEQSNTTDIRTHKLLVERESMNSPKYLDESINKIVKNISLLNNLKRNTSNNSFKTNFRYNKNRLTKNLQSPILQTSPLCSTPFKVKYRGGSIYKFSPISLKQNDITPNSDIEENNDDNATITFGKDNVVQTSLQSSSITHLSFNNFKRCNASRSLIYDVENNSQITSSNVDKQNILVAKKDLDSHHENKALSLDEISYSQITEAEPFLGFSNVMEDTPLYAQNIIVISPDKENAMPCQDTSYIKGDVSTIHVKGNGIESSLNSDAEISENNVSLDSEDSKIADISNANDNAISMLCLNTKEEEANRTPARANYSSKNDILLDSDDSEPSDKSMLSENVILMDSKNIIINKSSEVNLSLDSDSSKSDISENNIDSLSLHHSEEDTKSENAKCENNSTFLSDDLEQSNKSNVSKNNISLDSYDSEKCNKNDTSERNTSLSSENSEEESMYDTCDSEQSLLENNNLFDRQPTVTIDRMNDFLFMRYYVQMANYESQDEDNKQVNESYTSDNDDHTSCAKRKSSVLKSQDSSIGEMYNMENKLNTDEATDSPDINEDVISSNDDLNSSSNNEEEKCISFVTTRRRNEITNDSMYIFDNSYDTVSSGDCEKTVLSNAKISLTPKTILDVSVNIQNNIDSNEVITSHNELIKNISNNAEDKNTRKSIVKAKKNYRLSRQSNVTVSQNSDRLSTTGLQESDLDIHEDHQVTLTDKNKISADLERKEDKGLETSKIYSEYSDARTSITTRKRSTSKMPSSPGAFSKTDLEAKPSIVLQPGKKWERSLSIYRRMTMMADQFDRSILDDESLQTKGRKYRQSVISTMEMQECRGSLHNESINSRRSTFVFKPCRSTIRFVKDPDISRVSLSATAVYDDLKGFLNEECDDTLIELSKLSIADAEHEVTVLDNFHDTSDRLANARDYVLRRCNQADAILFDECYPDTVLKNCHKIGEGVYGEVFLWRGRDGRARVMKIVPIAGTVKVNGECQKDYDEIISEIVIAMELSALRAPIAEIDAHFEEGKNIDTLDLHAIDNATDVFNEVLAVRYVYGSYPSRLLDLWELYDECKGSENDNPGILPVDQHYIVLELANAGQDLESYQFNNAEQAHALFLQVAFGLAVGEEAFQFEHRDLHWGNVLIAPTDQKYATFVLRGRAHRVCRRGVAGTVIDYSLSRLSLPLAPLAPHSAALYNDLAADDALFDALGDYQFEVYRLMRDKLGNDWKNFEPYTNILWLRYIVDKMITALRYKRTNTKLHKQYIEKLKGIKDRILNYRSAVEFVLTDNE